MKHAKLFVAGRWQEGIDTSVLRDKYSGVEIGVVHQAGKEQVDQALAHMAEAQHVSNLSSYELFEILSNASQLLADREQAFVTSVVDDTGFTLADATREVRRAAQTLLLSAEETKRIVGEVVPVHGAPGGSDRIAFTTRHPLGVVCAITPFNSPLNTLSHKVGPALAAGNAVIIKPASHTPLTASLLVELLLEAGLPPGLIGLVHGGGATVGEWLLQSPIPAFYAFTGSTEVGTHIRRTVGLRGTQLELGSLSSTIICDDASLAAAVSACIGAAFRKAGQVCTSIQRLYVHTTVIDELAEMLSREMGGRPVGDPRQVDGFVGPVISGREADRLESWITDAVSGGAEVVGTSERHGSVITPTLLRNVDPAAQIFSEEAFGPVVSLVEFEDLDQAIADVNGTPYGLAAGIFTQDIGKAMSAASDLRMGSVHINETSSSRLDLMPYGGVKASGSGVEGPHYAVHEMTEQRLVTIGRP